MFENITGTTILIWIASALASKYLLPLILRNKSVRKAIKVADRTVDVVEGDPHFDYRTQPLTKYRPYKPVYHMTMGITKSSESAWLLVENTYAESIKYRQKIAASEPTETCICSQVHKKRVDAAVSELYNLVVDIMCSKYPTIFSPSSNEIRNLVTLDTLPKKANKTSPVELLKLLCENVEEDFLLLEHDPEVGEYVMRAATGIGANGYYNSHKLDRKLTDIHGPVPQYIQKLQLSMNRHFHRIRAEEYTQRLTWGIQAGGTVEDVYRVGGIHNAENEKPEPVNNLDVGSEVFLRVERQVLTRLRKSQFLVLSIRTYMYPLRDIKEEGSAKALAQAIRGWPEDVGHYKGRSRWGDHVLAYLDE